MITNRIESNVTSRVTELLFRQQNSYKRLAITRIAVATIGLVQVSWGAYDEMMIKLSEISWFGPEYLLLSVDQFTALRALATASLLLMLLGVFTRFATFTSWLLLLFFHFYSSSIVDRMNVNIYDCWIHLCLVFAASDRHYSLRLSWNRKVVDPGISKDELNSFLLFSCQVIVAMVFLQAFLTKIACCGSEWFTSGQTIYGWAVLNGTSLGRDLARSDLVYPMMSMSVLILEPLIAIGLLFKRSQGYCALLALAFHALVELTVDISFWHLWLLYPGLFILFNRDLREVPNRMVSLFSQEA